jgi:hypothetical protein
VPDGDIELVNLWATQYGWPATDAFLTEHVGVLQSDRFRVSLSVIADLYPDDPLLASLAAVLSDVDSHGLEVVLASGRAAHADAELLGTWMATPTWDDSASFLQEHRDELTTARMRALLAADSEEETSGQHLAILYLTDTLPLEQVYQIVTNPAIADEHALDLVESGDLDQLGLTLAAAPSIATEGITGIFLQTVVALANQDDDTARQFAALIVEHANLNQRKAFAIRLRALARHLPDQSPALVVASIIAPETDD